MCCAGSAKATEMAGGAGRGGEIVDRQRAGVGFPIPVLATGRICDSMRRLFVYLPLWVIGADVTGVASFWLAGLLQTELVTEVAFLALPHRSVCLWLADVV